MHPDLAGSPTVVESDVVWGEMDAFGHVNNVVYFRWFENARVAYVDRLGWFAMMTTEGIGPIVASASCQFKKPLKYPDRIASGIRLHSLEEDRVTVEHRVVSREWNALAAIGQSVIVCYDYRVGKKCAIPQVLRERIEKLG